MSELVRELCWAFGDDDVMVEQRRGRSARRESGEVQAAAAAVSGLLPSSWPAVGSSACLGRNPGELWRLWPRGPFDYCLAA